MSDLEKRLIVYKDGEPIMKFYVKAKHTLADIENHFMKKFPRYTVKVYNGKILLEPYDFNKITNGKILLTPTAEQEEQKQRKNILTGIRDVDLMILSKLSDGELFSFCLADKEAAALCRDENFWRNRFYQKYGKLIQEAPQLKPEEMKWKTFYLNLAKKLNIYKDVRSKWSFMNIIEWDLSTNTYRGSYKEEFWLLNLGETVYVELPVDRYGEIEYEPLTISAATFGEPYVTPRRVLNQIYQFYQEPITPEHLELQKEFENPYAEDWTEEQAEAGQVTRGDMIGQRFYEGFHRETNALGKSVYTLFLGT